MTLRRPSNSYCKTDLFQVTPLFLFWREHALIFALKVLPSINDHRETHFGLLLRISKSIYLVLLLLFTFGESWQVGAAGLSVGEKAWKCWKFWHFLRMKFTSFFNAFGLVNWKLLTCGGKEYRVKRKLWYALWFDSRMRVNYIVNLFLLWILDWCSKKHQNK